MKWVCKESKWSVSNQNGSVYCRKWVCNKSKRACTVKSGSVKSQSGMYCTNLESGSLKGQSGSVLKIEGL